MARKRMIDPEFWSDEIVGKLNSDAKLLFIGLWNFADDEGIFKYHPSLLASQIFPYEKNKVKQMDKMLKDIEENNLIFSYKRIGQGYGIILNFKKHQVISHPQPSKLPKPSIQNPKYKNAIFKRDDFLCYYCGKELMWQTEDKSLYPTIDHINPRIRNGNDLPNNLITACEHCNKAKKDLTPEQFLERYGNVNGTLLPNINQSNIREVKLREVKSSIVKVAKATFDHYILSFSKNKEQYQYTSLRKHKVEQRASELFAITNDIDKTQNLLFLAVDNRRASKFHMGENKEGKKYIDFIDHIFRSQEYTEKLIFEEHKKEIKRPEWMDDMLVKYKKRLEDAGKG